MERLWRSLKYEDVYLRDYADCLEAKRHRLLDHILQQPSPHQAAADMMDNARALPTCPQPQQQPQTALIAA
jgi:putative transposase